MGTGDRDDGQAQLWRRAYEIFDDLLEKPKEERDQLARALAAGDSALLAIVFDLLRNATEEGLDTVAEEEPRVGSKIGRYEITAKLGRGGMGHVYAARDTELGRVVALKFLSGQTGSPGGGSADRLIQEAKAASALNHPNIVTVYDVVRQGSEIALAMELIEGQSMRELCDRPQPVENVVRWARQIAQALAATHARGIVHRDIKPENVMLRPDGYVKVLDFGLARRSRLPGASTSLSSSLFGGLGGTLSYMSPEQTRGDSPTPASDIFSLGSMLYELLCGRHPFQSGSPIDTAYAIAHQDPKRAESIRSEIPGRISSLLHAMMAKDPAVRPTAADLAEDCDIRRNRSDSGRCVDLARPDRQEGAFGSRAHHPPARQERHRRCLVPGRHAARICAGGWAAVSAAHERWRNDDAAGTGHSSIAARVVRGWQADPRQRYRGGGGKAFPLGVVPGSRRP